VLGRSGDLWSAVTGAPGVGWTTAARWRPWRLRRGLGCPAPPPRSDRRLSGGRLQPTSSPSSSCARL